MHLAAFQVESRTTNASGKDNAPCMQARRQTDDERVWLDDVIHTRSPR